MPEQSPFSALLDFLDHLDSAHIYYRLRYTRPRMISVDVDVPSGRWEVEFEEDGNVDVEIFTSRQGVGGAESLAELYALIEEDEIEAGENITQ